MDGHNDWLQMRLMHSSLMPIPCLWSWSWLLGWAESPEQAGCPLGRPSELLWHPANRGEDTVRLDVRICVRKRRTDTKRGLESQRGTNWKRKNKAEGERWRYGGMWLLTLSLFSMEAPASSSILTISTCPLDEALCNAVLWNCKEKELAKYWFTWCLL